MVVSVVRVGREYPHGMAVNSFASVSLDPPLVRFNAGVETTIHVLVAEAGHHVVNNLAEKQD